MVTSAFDKSNHSQYISDGFGFIGGCGRWLNKEDPATNQDTKAERETPGLVIVLSLSVFVSLWQMSHLD
jgi:hypothetical protein